ncbi:MAG: sigma-70 family RNA polymerase sigma factor [Spirochaetales bacterium]|nr:sigma-70 family RNA polymerase sigma factor [Spirochaetales bacterium]
MNGTTDPQDNIRQEEAQLCLRILNGDLRAFSTLAGRYRRRVLSLGMSFFHNLDDAEDFVQDVLVKVYVSLASFRGESRFSTWLMRIAYNTAINSVKRRKEYTSLAEDFEVVDESGTPEDEHLRNCSRDAIREAVSTLPERYRVCVDLYFFYDMPYADIGEVTGQPVNTIKSHVFRAKKLLRSFLIEGDEP